jgi:hypothetical protein
MYSPQRALSTFASGSISHPKLCLPHTKKLSGLLGLPLFVPEVETVHIVHPVEIVTDIAARKMKVHQENIGHNLLVWVGVLLGSRDLYLVVGKMRKPLTLDIPASFLQLRYLGS